MTSDIHRIFIQTLLARRVMTQEVALQLYGRAVEICQKVEGDFVTPHPVTEKGLQDFLSDITTSLEEVRMSVATGREETKTGTMWIALINTDATDIALTATDYSPIELSYIRAVIDGIITSYPANSIGSTRALALVSDLKSAFPKSQGELVLSSAVSRGWLRKSKRGRYSLAPRSLMELEIYLKDQYEDYIYICQRCSKIVLTGIKCEHDTCEAHMHEYCYNTYKRHRGATCPKCKKSFEDVEPSFLGEKAAKKDTDQYRSAPGKKRKRTSRAQEDQEEEDSEREFEDEEGMSASQSQSQTQTQARHPRTSRAGPVWNAESSVIPETQYEDQQDELESSQSSRPRRR